MRRSSHDVERDEAHQRIVMQQRPPDRDGRCPFCDSENGWHQMSRQVLRWSWEQEPDADYDGFYEKVDAPGNVYTRCGYCCWGNAGRDGMRKVETERLWEWCHEEESGGNRSELCRLC